jgi:hypothetical protein
MYSTVPTPHYNFQFSPTPLAHYSRQAHRAPASPPPEPVFQTLPYNVQHMRHIAYVDDYRNARIGIRFLSLFLEKSSLRGTFNLNTEKSVLYLFI